MRILIGVTVLLVVALGASLDTEEASSATSTVPQGGFSEDVIDVVIGFKWQGVPDAAITEYFAEGLGLHHASVTEEMVNCLVEFGRKWNLPMFSTLQYDPATQQAVSNYTSDKPDSDNPKEKHLSYALLTSLEKTLGAHQPRVPEVAFEEFYAAGFHILPVSEETYRNIIEWAMKWNIKEIAGMTYDAEKMDLVPKADSVVLAELEQEFNKNMTDSEIRVSFARMVVLPEGAVEDFIAGGFLHFPFNDEKFDRALEFCKKWNLTKEFYNDYMHKVMRIARYIRLAATSLPEKKHKGRSGPF